MVDIGKAISAVKRMQDTMALAGTLSRKLSDFIKKFESFQESREANPKDDFSVMHNEISRVALALSVMMDNNEIMRIFKAFLKARETKGVVTYNDIFRILDIGLPGDKEEGGGK